MPENNSTSPIYLLVGILAAAIVFGLMYNLGTFINEFSQELRYLNNEIKRSRGSERKYYISKRRRLWLSLIPFIKY